ncbi:GAF domain-containing protein [Cryobacterium sp. TMS1-20-1]|uniref:GAF domain-containing protein n=1 Tax=Cryobacterium sp. TMS1-20-1 TaxID=1259223 RepID=UPI00106B6E4C|nr:GAF domain-containing protein [Cryobacterium sp. TMS1-20-1]TFC79430.1 GAF domain-containing protein [Cryobacterium sp. TMS1-20-1]
MMHSDAGRRMLIRESWQRSLRERLSPDAAATSVDLAADGLRDLRNGHPLADVLPVVHNLLIRHAVDAGLIVAVSDERGRLLWVDGDHAVRRRAEAMRFVEGTDWSERTRGTNAPGTALATRQSVQIHQDEHFTRLAASWSCTAAPVRDPTTRALLGTIDITGFDHAVAPQTLPMVEAAVAAIEAELRLIALKQPEKHTRLQRTGPSADAKLVEMRVLGRDHGQVAVGNHTGELRPRHAEILALLAWHPQGLSAERLTILLHEHTVSVDHVRAEMVRLRKQLTRLAPGIIIESQPYRLRMPVALDAREVLDLLDRGAHRAALAKYHGAVLPSSVAPGIVDMRSEVSGQLRQALLSDASADLLLAYARTDEAHDDAQVWQACLDRLPSHSAKRAGVIARLTTISAEIGTPARF